MSGRAGETRREPARSEQSYLIVTDPAAANAAAFGAPASCITAGSQAYFPGETTRAT